MRTVGEITIEPIVSFYGETVYTICDAVGVVYTSISQSTAEAVFEKLAPNKAASIKMAAAWCRASFVCKMHGPSA